MPQARLWVACRQTEGEVCSPSNSILNDEQAAMQGNNSRVIAAIITCIFLEL